MAPPRIYADTSIYGGAFDPGFQTHSRTFFDQVRQGRFRLVTSPSVAPPEIIAYGQQAL